MPGNFRYLSPRVRQVRGDQQNACQVRQVGQDDPLREAGSLLSPVFEQPRRAGVTFDPIRGVPAGIPDISPAGHSQDSARGARSAGAGVQLERGPQDFG
ncbi:hypothetical protein PMKS-001602 [Pichia membranifaciens]|uniref:Uncharacterized protein n=1 Tax=Pichia membranifaciens TaxID=4926 RepID=A0A1Q2YFH1_9ASCO|nr:hypothetical protein PMKS-001602 [Pichia membranifaciens]